ncbi:MAG: FeoB-associated Cys-rich membrane protein [Clostridia bacterium]|nr:FeoB-associated Cys-rich membrane protein [Clostridia bacterium]
MMSWLAANIGSIIVVLILAAVVALIVWKMARDRKAGRHICGGSCGTCSGGCGGCPMAGKCGGGK